MVWLALIGLTVWLIVQQQWIGAILVLVLAKLLGLGVTAFIFEVTKDKLLQMAWFRRVYEFFIWAREWAHRKVDPVARRLRKWRHVLQPRQSDEGGDFLRGHLQGLVVRLFGGR